ncbi:MAG: DUF4286 family protein [Chitinophagia bacterium]|jgi:hypothetical protein
MPIVYSITTKVSQEIAPRWLLWMQEEHIPAILSTGHFSAHQLLQLLDQDDSEGPTYSLQLTAQNRSLYETYLNECAPALREEAFRLWGNQFISFRSILEVVN